MNTQDALRFIAEQIENLDTDAKTCLEAHHDEEASMHFQTIKQLAELNNLIEELDQKLTPALSPITILPSELMDIPDDLRSQLSTDTFELKILEIIEDFKGTISLDRLLLEWYKRYNNVLNRRNVTAKLYRMVKSGMLYSGNQKGVYSIHDPKKNDENHE